MGDTGLEQGVDSPGKAAFSENGGAESGALGAQSGVTDADLARVIKAWPTLTVAIRAGIVAMVKAAARANESFSELA
jgi:hypothetical protein